MNTFKAMSERALKVISERSEGKALYSDRAVGGITSVLLDVVVDIDVEIPTDNMIAENASSYSNTATFKSMEVAVGAKLMFGNKTWTIGRTVTDDNSLIMVIIS